MNTILSIGLPIVSILIFSVILWKRGGYLRKKIQQAAPEPPSKFEKAKSQLEVRVWTVADILDNEGWIIPDEKMQSVFDYVTQTFVKHGHMKPERVARKVVENFKLIKKSAA